MSNINITDNAFNEIISSEKVKKADCLLRVFVSTGGCYGFEYKIFYDTTVNKNDQIISKNDQNVIVIDLISLKYLENSTVDFIEEIGRSYFSIINPNSKKNCGCGNSFTI